MGRGESPSLRELTLASLKIGCLGFGGPVGQIALMHKVFVDEKKWIDEPRYLAALNYCMLLPGPEAQQLAVYVGWLLKGVPGGLIAGVLFVLPGALLVFALSWLYAAYADVPALAAVFYGVKAAVVAIVAEAMLRIGKRALKGRSDVLIAAAAFAALFLFGVPFPVVILAAAGIGAARALRDAPLRGAPQGEGKPLHPEARTEGPPRDGRGAFRAAAGALAVWLAPVALAFALLGEDHVLTRVGLLFSKLAVVTFGGAYAVLAYLQQQAVEAEGWLSAAAMIDGFGLAETTPGPLVLVNQFVGFLAGWNAGGGLLLAAACAAMASWATFAPSFFMIFAGAPYAERLRRNPYAQGALRAVTAAVLGVIGSLALWFALEVLFAERSAVTAPWGHALFLPELASLDFAAASLALAAAAALIRFKINIITVIAGAAASGLALRLIA